MSTYTLKCLWSLYSIINLLDYQNAGSEGVWNAIDSILVLELWMSAEWSFRSTLSYPQSRIMETFHQALSLTTSWL